MDVDDLFIKSVGDEKDDEVIVSLSSLRMEMITRRKTRGRMIFLFASTISGETLNANATVAVAKMEHFFLFLF